MSFRRTTASAASLRSPTSVCSDARAVRDQQRRLPHPSERETLETLAVSDSRGTCSVPGEFIYRALRDFDTRRLVGEQPVPRKVGTNHG